MERGPLRNDRAFLPYGIGIRMQRALVAQPAVRRLFARELDALRRWQAELGMPHDEQTRRISLLANTWLWWRQRSLVDPDVFARWVIVSGAGWPLVERASSPHGVVLVVPHVGTSIVPLEQVLRLRGRETARVVTDRSLPRTGDRATWEAQQTPARAAQLWQARQVLQRGGVVLIAGDGLGGQRTVDVPFWGRRWPFQVGAAALAVEAGALFVPVWVTFDAASRVQMEVAAPLVAHAAAEEERIAELTRQYGQLYAARWPEFYASARWQYLTYALELPAA
jgi:lauroyl/myristoyl acyltransferase